MDNFVRNIDFYGYNETFLSPVALIVTLVMCVLIFGSKKGSAAVPVFIVASYITFIQRIVIAGLDFDMLRIVVLASLARIFIKGEQKNIKPNTLDRTVFFFVIIMIVMHTVQRLTFGAFVNKVGFGLNFFGAYLVIRVFLEQMEDAAYFMKAMAIIAVPLALSMLGEQIVGKNIFSALGGVPENTMFRGGRLRSQGSFSHPILAGTFGATIFPVFYAFWKTASKGKGVFLLGVIASLLITFTSSSSGPLITLIASVFALLLWRYRQYMRYLRWGAVIALIGLSLVMKAPVYALIWRMTLVTGSTGYHRYALIDQFFKHFGDWWFAGTRGLAQWAWGLQDITNQYVLVGVEGGLLTLLTFIAIILIGFKKLGVTMKERESMGDRENTYLLWALGSALFAHAVSFMGVSYVSKMMIFFVLILGLIGSLSQESAFKDNSMIAEGKNS